jgi:hypothetical protein
MNADAANENTKPLCLAMVVTIITSALSAFLLFKLNGIVHGQLYDFGLQFNLIWASPYWEIERMLYMSFAISPMASGLVLVYSFWKTKRGRVPLTRRAETKLIAKEVKPIAAEMKPTVSKTPIKTAPVGNSMVITCPKCKRVFGRPLSMLDFSKGPAQLVNVCPYCNYILGSAAEDSSDGTRVILPDKTEIEQK